jgi:Domain of unknown function (DUF5925)
VIPPPDPITAVGTPQPGLWLERYDLAAQMVLQAQWDGTMPYQRSEEVAGTVADPQALLPEGAVLRLERETGSGRTIVAALPGFLVNLDVHSRVMTLEVVGADLTGTEALLEGLVRDAKAPAVAPEGRVEMGFWSSRDGDGVQSSRQRHGGQRQP